MKFNYVNARRPKKRFVRFGADKLGFTIEISRQLISRGIKRKDFEEK